MIRVRVHQLTDAGWCPLAWLLWDSDERCLRVWEDESTLSQPDLDALSESLSAGQPAGWIAEDLVFSVHDEQPPGHAATDRQRLGIRCDVPLTRDLIRDRLRAEVAKLEATATRLRGLCPEDELRPNALLDELGL